MPKQITTEAGRTLNIPKDSWMGKHRGKAKFSQERTANVLKVVEAQVRQIEKAKEPNTWCARALDLFLDEYGLEELERLVQKAERKRKR